MGLRSFGVAIAAGAAVGVWSSGARGAIVISNSAGASRTAGSSHEGSSPSSSFIDDAENTIGGHGYSQLSVNFGAGVITGRNHACVGPAFQYSDEAGGYGSAVLTDQVFTVVGNTLPPNTMVDVTICLSYTSEMHGIVLDGAGGNNFCRNTVSAHVGGVTVASGSHSLTSNWQNYSGTGSFAGEDGGTATLSRAFSFSIRVGQTFTIDMSATSNTQASDINLAPGSYPLASGSAGFALTFGLGAISDGAHLEWAGQDWFGSCADSVDLVPDNPIPGAPTASVVALGLLAAGRRRR